MIDWALGHARRQRTANDRAFPFGYQPRRPDDAAFAEARDFWRHHGVSPDHGESIICFFGTLGRHFECETVVAAAKLLQAGGCRARFVLCGGGPDLERWRRLSASCTNVTVPGWVNADRIWALMKMSKLGLAPYVSTWDFMLSIPNKPVEYLAAGLPVLSSLQGVLADLLLRHHCGITYANGSAAELAAAVHDCCEHPQKRDAMSAHAAQLFASRFAAENVYSQMESYLVEQAAAVRVRAA
jgi:glycosyltransferase involved in cell wall biosynthesis